MPEVQAPIQKSEEAKTGDQPKQESSNAKDLIAKGIAPELPKTDENAQEGQPQKAGEPAEGFYSGDPQQLAPELKSIYNSMLTDYKKKMEEIKALRQDHSQEAKNQAIREALDNLSVEDLGTLAEHPRFMQVLPQYLQMRGVQIPQAQELDTSYMSDTEKTLFERNKNLEKELQAIRQELGTISRTSQAATIATQDSNLRTKYGNVFNPERVNSFLQEVLSGRKQLDREFIHRALDYEDAVKRAYEYGRKDSYEGTPEKERASFLSSLGTRSGEQSYEVPKQEPKENIKDYMFRLAQNAKNQLAQGKVSPYISQGERKR